MKSNVITAAIAAVFLSTTAVAHAQTGNKSAEPAKNAQGNQDRGPNNNDPYNQGKGARTGSEAGATKGTQNRSTTSGTAGDTTTQGMGRAPGVKDSTDQQAAKPVGQPAHSDKSRDKAK